MARAPSAPKELPEELYADYVNLTQFDPIELQDTDGKPKDINQIDRKWRKFVTGRIKITDNVVFGAGMCRYVGQDYDYPMVSWNDVLKAKLALVKAEVAKLKPQKKETDVEKAARLAKELDELGLKAVPK